MISVLIVENARLLSNIIAKELIALNYECSKTYSFKGIEEQLSKNKFDFIILSLYLSDGEGVELVQKVKKLSNAKLIVLTSSTDEKQRNRLFNSGVIDYFLKENISQTVININNLIQNIVKNNLINILIIDDSKIIRERVKAILTPRNYNILESDTGQGGIDIIEDNNNKVDLLILDMELDDMHGTEVLSHIKLNQQNNFPIIVLSGTKDANVISKVLKGGASDFIKKPLIIEEFLLKINLWVEYYRKSIELDDYKHNLEHKIEDGISEIKTLNKEIEDTQKEVIFTMGSIGEGRSKETGNHVKRVAQYSYLLAKFYGLTDDDAELLKLASPMHDIGKVAIPDSVLNKPGRFNDEERIIMNNHSKLGYEMLCHSDRQIMKTAAIVAYEHHERWDGKGYPRGLKGEDIHIFGRITAIADVFDALGSQRVYKPVWEDEKIWKLFKEEKDKQFEGKLVDVFFDNLDEFLKVRKEYTDCF